MRAFVAIAVAMAFAGCVQDLGATGDVIARDAAKSVVNGVVQTRFPGVNAAPLTDCIIDNASGSEVIQIAQAAVVGTTPATTDLVVEIAGRPETIRCGLSNVLGFEGINL